MATYVGIDIGTSDVKLAVVSDGNVRSVASTALPDNSVRDGKIISPELMAEFLKGTLKDARVSTSQCAFLLPASVAYTRTMTLPAMSHENLILNLPYEFRDFITLEKDKYFYDYALLGSVRDESGEATEYEIIAATTLKDTIGGYGDMCRRAGLKLKIAIPEEIAYMNVLNQYRDRNKLNIDEREFGFVDIGHLATKLHIYRGSRHQATRVIEYGVGLLDNIIAERYNIDEHIARAYKHANNSGEQTGELCLSLYGNISLELVRAVNFYRFNSPDSALTDIYICGGGSKIAPLTDSIRDELQLETHAFSELLPEAAKDMEDVSICHLAIGAAMQ